MNAKTIEMSSEAYIKNLEQKQQYYGIDDHDLGQAKKWINSFTNYLLWLEETNTVAIEKTIKKGKEF